MTHEQDCGDGGYTMYAYNSEDELIADHYLTRCAQQEGKELDPEVRRKILTEEVPRAYALTQDIRGRLVARFQEHRLRFHARGRVCQPLAAR